MRSRPSDRGARGPRNDTDATGAALDWPRTLAAKGAVRLRAGHLLYRERIPSGGTVHCFLLDCSASMMCSGRLALAKAMLHVWCEALYGTREAIVVIGFGGSGAQLLKAPGTAPVGATWIRTIEGGGGTPIVAALSATEKTLHRLRRQSPTARIACWLLTDGRFAVLPASPAGADWCAVVDFDSGGLAVGRSKEVASRWSATYMSACELVEQA